MTEMILKLYEFIAIIQIYIYIYIVSEVCEIWAVVCDIKS